MKNFIYAAISASLLLTISSEAQSSNFFAAKNGTYSTSRRSSLNTYIGTFTAKKYRLEEDDTYRLQPTITIAKDPHHQPYGYTLEINFPCSTSKVTPTIYSIDYNSSKIELAEEGSAQCTILEDFKISMTSQLDMGDGGLYGQRIRLHVGYLSPSYPDGFVDFELAPYK